VEKTKKLKRNIWDDSYTPYGTFQGDVGNPEQWKNALDFVIFSRQKSLDILKNHNETPYEILGVSRNESPERIKLVWRALCLEHHPDKGGDRQKFEKIMAAYSLILSQF
jgi:DnaJ-class molecular chaperone